MTELVGKSIGNYVVKKRLGAGGMGTVYVCEHPLLERKAALKVLHDEMAQQPEVVDRFFHEAKAATEIGHPNIIDVLDFGRVRGEGKDDIVYLLMEYLEGESLGARQQRQALSLPEIQHIMAQCCAALQVSHQKGIVHRDLKPENIYVVHKGEDPLFVKILDFGIAKLLTDETAQYHTRTGVVLGTPWYMSPEQCAGKGQIDARSDIYSLGIVLYELLVGRVPFNEKGYGDVIIGHLTKEPPHPTTFRPGLPAEWEAVVMHAIEKDREHRFQTMDELAAAIADPATHATHYHHQAVHSREPSPHSADPFASTVTADVAETEERVHAAPTMISGAIEMTTGQGMAPITGQTTAPVTGQTTAELDRRHGARIGLAFGLAALAATFAVASFIGLVLLGLWTQRSLAALGAARPASTVAAPAASPTGPATKDTVIVHIVTEPGGATLVRLDNGEEELGRAPYDLKLARGSQPIAIQARLPGYRTMTRVVKADQASELTLALAPLPATSAAHP